MVPSRVQDFPLGFRFNGIPRLACDRAKAVASDIDMARIHLHLAIFFTLVLVGAAGFDGDRCLTNFGGG